MKRILTSAVVTFTFLTQSAFAQFAGNGYANVNFSGAGSQFSNPGYLPQGYGVPSGYGAGYYPAQQACPYNTGAAPGSVSQLDDQQISDALSDKIQDLEDKLNEIDSNANNGKNALEDKIRGVLPSDFAAIVFDHVEGMGDCSCLPETPAPATPAARPPGARPARPANKNSSGTQAMNDLQDTQCFVFGEPDFKAQFPVAFADLAPQWNAPTAAPTATSKLDLKMDRSIASADREPANEHLVPRVPKKRKANHNKGDDSQGDIPTPAPIAQLPPPLTQAPVPVGASCPAPAPTHAGTCSSYNYWNGPKGVCKDRGYVDGRVCTNEFLDTMDTAPGHHTNQQVSDCRRDLRDLYQLLKRRKSLQAQIDKLHDEQFKLDTGAYDEDATRGRRQRTTEAGSGSGHKTSNLLSILSVVGGLGLSAVGAYAGYKAGSNNNGNCTEQNLRLGYPCQSSGGGNFGAIAGMIAGSQMGLPFVKAGLYSAVAAGGTGSCGGSSYAPYGAQPYYGQPGIPGQGGAFGYPQGYGPLNAGFPGANINQIGGGALVPGAGYYSQGLANPFGSPFGPSPFGGVAGPNGGFPGVGNFGGYNGFGNGGFGNQFGGNQFGNQFGGNQFGGNQFGNNGYTSGALQGINPIGAQNELAYRYGSEIPQGYYANLASAGAILNQANIGYNQIAGGNGYSQYGSQYGNQYGGQYGGQYGQYGQNGVSLNAAFNFGGNASSGYYQPQYSLGNSSFSSLSPSATSSVFGPTNNGTLGTTSTSTPFGH
jgi:hypothetical protein